MYNTNWTDEGGVKQEAQLMLTNLRDAYIGQSRSPNIVSFHVIYSFLLPVCNSNLRHAIFTIFDFKKCCDLEIGVRRHSVVPFDRLCMVSY